MAVKLSKIEKILLGTSIVLSWASISYCFTSHPDETYSIIGRLIAGATIIEPIGKAIYQGLCKT